jgi:hypothetical protein
MYLRAAWKLFSFGVSGRRFFLISTDVFLRIYYKRKPSPLAPAHSVSHVGANAHPCARLAGPSLDHGSTGILAGGYPGFVPDIFSQEQTTIAAVA